jgi:hypothetical protein
LRRRSLCSPRWKPARICDGAPHRPRRLVVRLSLAKGCSERRGRSCEPLAPLGPLRGARQPTTSLKNRHSLDRRSDLWFSVCSCRIQSPTQHAEYGRAFISAVTPHVSPRDRRGSANERCAGREGRQRLLSLRGRHNPLKRLKTAKEKKGNPRESKGNPRQFQGKTKECRGIPRKSKSMAPALRRSADRRRFIHGDRPKGGPNSRRRRPLTPGFAWSGGGRARDRVRSE